MPSSPFRCRWAATPLALAAASLFLPGAWAQCAGVATAPGAMAAQIVALAGQGQTRPAGEGPWSPAALAQQLGAGTGVRTLELSSAALLLADRTQIRMSANAQLRLCASQPERTLLELAAGRLWARTKKTPAALELQTPAALAVVRGTDWDVEVDGSGRTTLTVLSGQVDLSNAFGRVELGPAEQGYVEPGKAPVKRVLVRPRDRVQWVMANPVDPTRWVELQGDAVAPPLAAIRDDLRAGQWPRAREQLQALSASGQGGAVIDLLLADLEVFADQMDAAGQRLAAAWQRTRDPRTAARRAELLLALDRGAEARTWLDAARAQAPDATALLLADGDWHRLEGRGDEAIALYRRAVAGAQGRQEPAGDQAAAQWSLGRALRERGDLRGAREALARAVALAPEQPAYQGEQATLAAEALRLGDARSGFDAALALAGDDYVSLAGAGLVALQQGDPAGARTQLLKALVIEPRYARAQVWLAVAEYHLGERAAALDSLARAKVADPKDPLPWQVESVLRNDQGEPIEAIAAAREALTRLPYLKSLDPLTSDSQGSANLGKALGDFGLEHWARAYASASYYPLWAGSHFFLANRYESDFSRNSERYQGYLSDPTAFGASEKQAPLVLTQGGEWLWIASAERGPLHDTLAADVGHHGFAAAPVPVAWQVRTNGVQMWPNDGNVPSYRLSSPGFDVALGLRPTESLGLFLLHTEHRLRYSFPDGRDFGNGITFNGLARQRSERTDLGGSWRWSPDAQTWLKLHRARFGQGLVLDDAAWGPQGSRVTDQDDGVLLRHTLQWGGQRLSLGWEGTRGVFVSSLSDPLVTSAQGTRVRFQMPWLAGEWRQGPWTWHAEAYWARLAVQRGDRFYDSLTGEDLLDPTAERGGRARQPLPRLGLSYRLGPGRALHLAYIESVRSPGSHTLSPVALGAIAIDHQYQLPGAFGRKRAAQFDWEFDARTFGFATMSSQDVVNPTLAGGGLALPPRGLVNLDRVGSLGAQIQTGQTVVDPYNENPEFSQGRLHQAGLALNRVLAPRWSVLGSYTWARSRNLGSQFAGNALPGFARHTLALASVWKHGGRDLTAGSLVYRGSRFADEANATPRRPGWDLVLAHSLESADRRWAFIATAQAPLNGDTRPTLWARVRYRD
ncbi:tetratricopeptide repeat protein [Acidovorax sp.]|uniref:tetratricopeptide repeat protein n=1 Tax=Acidovorax sp. TaxID=1872122 RepID=UPI00391F7B2D